VSKVIIGLLILLFPFLFVLLFTMIALTIKDEAIELGGNAVVGVDMFDQVLGVHNDMIMMLVGVKGTAVVVD
jgi:hypothetical protein